jgi:hypothetical protein
MLAGLDALMEEIYLINAEKGWYDKPREFSDDTQLITEEASEAYREYRKGHEPDEIYGECKQCCEIYTGAVDFHNPCTNGHCGGIIEPKGIPVELIDVVIRALDSCKRGNIRPSTVMALKLAYNRQRSYQHGDKRT